MALPAVVALAARLGIAVGSKALKKILATKAKKARKYKMSPKSFKKKPMTQAQARHATRPQKKYETKLEIGGKKYKLKDSDGGRAAARKGINSLDRSDAPLQRLKPKSLPHKKGKTKIVVKGKHDTHWSEKHK